MYKNRRHLTEVECRLFCCPILLSRCRFCNFLKLLSYRHTANPDLFYYSKTASKIQSQPSGTFRTAAFRSFDQCLSASCRFNSAISAFISAISTFSFSSHSSRVCAYTFRACFLPSIHLKEWSKEQCEAEKRRKFELKQQKRKEQHKGH